MYISKSIYDWRQISKEEENTLTTYTHIICLFPHFPRFFTQTLKNQHFSHILTALHFYL